MGKFVWESRGLYGECGKREENRRESLFLQRGPPQRILYGRISVMASNHPSLPLGKFV